MKISVCMATYNGASFVEAQVISILDQLRCVDELVIVDDCSSDATFDLVSRITDTRIRLYQNETNRKEVYTFERAISLANGDFIFLADQDDIWEPRKVGETIDHLNREHACLVSSNFLWIDALGRNIDVAVDGVSSSDSRRYFKNILGIFLGRTSYYGCAMAFRAELKALILPFPSWIECHDHWIPLAANMLRSNSHIDDALFLKRDHENNATSPISRNSLFKKMRSRCIMAGSVAVLFWKILFARQKSETT
jgi:glycosyltransferase involved in cell wall biosynthesis